MDDQGKLEIIKQNIEAFPNFPKSGIVFRDIFSALTKGEVCTHLRDLMVSAVREKFPRAEMIVGLESRGFLFNLMIAAELGIGCAPIRKKGKLPGNCVSVEYTLEYGKDVFEIQTKAIKPNQRVVIVDDLLATGGSLDAAIKLVKKAGGEVLGSLVVMELVDLNGREKLGCCVHSLIKYKCK